jgi:UrcA family protein
MLQGCALYDRLYAEAGFSEPIQPPPSQPAAQPAPSEALVQPTPNLPAAQPTPSQPPVQPTAKVEKVVVVGLRNRVERSRFGGQIRYVSVSRAVRFDDLDLSTPWGRAELRTRVRVMAGNLCGQLERRYPIEASRGQSCYRQAVGPAMRRAEEVIADTRYDYWRR